MSRMFSSQVSSPKGLSSVEGSKLARVHSSSKSFPVVSSSKNMPSGSSSVLGELAVVRSTLLLSIAKLSTLLEASSLRSLLTALSLQRRNVSNFALPLSTSVQCEIESVASRPRLAAESAASLYLLCECPLTCSKKH